MSDQLSIFGNHSEFPNSSMRSRECGPYALDPERRIKALGGKGILNKSDVPDLDGARERIWKLFLDSKWHSAEEIVRVSGQREGLRRMRELRSRSYRVERRRNGESRDFEYRLVKA